MIDLSALTPTTEELTWYHSGKPSRISHVPLEEREFIAWDGEGTNVDGPNMPQHYTLFGCSTGEYVSAYSHLHTFDLLDFIIKIGEANPAAYHIGFSFNYDANMILRSLTEARLRRIHEKGHITLRRKADGTSYYLDFLPGKWFQVTKRKPEWDPKTNPAAKTTVKIYDIFSFFGTSFIKAYENLIGPVPDVVKEGKAARNDFAAMSEEYVKTYWTAEIEMLRELAEELRNRLYAAGLKISQWHGPGALANFVLNKNHIKEHMAECPKEVREAAAYGYAGGRFEMFRLGRTVGPIYSMDINSAYPAAIAQLPSLTVGGWNHTIAPKRIARFGIYRVRLLPRAGGTFVERPAGPLFHRDKMGNISFPWVTEGWYWSPEVRNLRKLKSEQYEIVEGWEYLGYQDAGRPFDFVKEVYELRRQWKAEGNKSEWSLKLALNSLYGKMAQRVGWNEENRTAPKWHQLEWAGWVTSNCRAMLWDLMSQIPREKLLAVETDGIYTTHNPTELGITSSKELGGWEVEVYDEILYVQSGLAWLRKGECPVDCRHDGDKARGIDPDIRCAWICKRRGLDPGSFKLDECRDYLGTLRANEDWTPFVGKTHRFIGLGAALASNAPLKLRHCVWQTVDREVLPGKGGKRVHINKQCEACRKGLSTWDMAHDMSIRSLAYFNPASHPHDIPWEDTEDRGYLWRQQSDQGEVVR